MSRLTRLDPGATQIPPPLWRQGPPTPHGPSGPQGHPDPTTPLEPEATQTTSPHRTPGPPRPHGPPGPRDHLNPAAPPDPRATQTPWPLQTPGPPTPHGPSRPRGHPDPKAPPQRGQRFRTGGTEKHRDKPDRLFKPMSNSENKREIQKEVLVLTANIYIITECLQLPLRHTDQDSFPPSV